MTVLSLIIMQVAGLRGFEWIIIVAIIVALFFGVKKIPELARSLGRASGEYQRAKIEMDKELHRVNKVEGNFGERNKLESIAEKLGIDYSGKTDEELRQSITKGLGEKKTS